MTMLRPKDLIDQLAISASALRLWSEKFGPVLSPGASKSQTETGGSAQRRYTQEDLAVLARAKQLLGESKTYEETLAILLEEGPQELPELQGAVSIIQDVHPVIKAFEEVIRAKDDTIEALHLVVRSKDQELQSLQAARDETIMALRETIAGQNRHIATLEKNQQPPPQTPQPPSRFRWGFLNRLLTDGVQDVG